MREWEPSLEQIAEETARIRATWSPEERERRCVKNRHPDRGPRIKVVGTKFLGTSVLSEMANEIHRWPFYTEAEDKRAIKPPKEPDNIADKEVVPNTDIVDFGTDVTM